MGHCHFKHPTLDFLLQKAHAIIFDYNGLIVDDEPIQLRDFNEVFKNFHINISEETFISECVGTRPPEVFAHIFDKYKIDENSYNIKECVLAWRQSRANIKDSLAELGFTDNFDLLITSEGVSQGKPHPKPYLLASQRLQISPEKCLVFEDTSSGVQSATIAEMNCIAVPNRFTHNQNFTLANGINRIIRS